MDPRLPPSRTAAQRATEQLQVTGERERVKGWLQDELQRTGWNQKLQQHATQLVEQRAQQKHLPPLTTRQLALQMRQLGHGKL